MLDASDRPAFAAFVFEKLSRAGMIRDLADERTELDCLTGEPRREAAYREKFGERRDVLEARDRLCFAASARVDPFDVMRGSGDIDSLPT